MNKKYFSLLVVVLLVVAIAALSVGCGGTTSNEPNTPPAGGTGAHLFEGNVVKHCACGNAVVTDAAGTVTKSGDCVTGTDNAGATVGCDGAILEWTPTATLPTTTGNYYLTGNITLTAEVKIPTDTKIAIDLNGCTVTGLQAVMNGDKVGTNGERVLSTDAGSELTLTDTSAAKTGTIVGGSQIKAEGGALLLKGKTTIYNITVKDGSSNKKNGGNIVAQGDLIAFGLKVFNGQSKTTGGGMYVKDATVHLFNALFENNKGNGSGAGMYVYSGKVYVYDSTFKYNKSSDDGGNVATFGDKAPTFNAYRCTFDKGEAGDVAGNLFICGPSVLEGCTISSGKAASYGGNIMWNPACTEATVKDCTITGGTGRNGGSLRTEAVKIDFINTKISGGSTPRYGGNVYVGGTGVATFDKDCLIENGSTTEADGGNMYILSAANVIFRGTMKNGTAGDSGGNICNEGALTLDGATILGGTAVKENSSVYIITSQDDLIKVNWTVIKDTTIDAITHVFTWPETEGSRKVNGELTITGNSKLADFRVNPEWHASNTTFTDLGAEADINVKMIDGALTEYQNLAGRKIGKVGTGANFDKIKYLGRSETAKVSGNYLVW